MLARGIGLFFLFAVLAFPLAAEARLTFGVTHHLQEMVGGAPVVEEWRRLLEAALSDEVRLLVFADEATLLEWMERYRSVELGLVSRATALRQPAGRFFNLADLPEPQAVFLARQGISATLRRSQETALADLSRPPAANTPAPPPALVEASPPVVSAATVDPPPVAAISPVESGPTAAVVVAEPHPLPQSALEVQRRAIELARSGELDEALTILAELHQLFPEDRRIRQDYLVVLGWAERDAEAVVLAQDMDLSEAPDYVLEALGKSLRNTQHFEAAVALYALALQRSPDHFPFQAGSAYALAEARRFAEARTRVALLLQKYPEDSEVLQIAAYVEKSAGDRLAALAYHQRTLALAPEHIGARRERILLLDELGATHLALSYAEADAHLLSREEWLLLQTNLAAHRVRWSALPPPSPQARFAEADRTLEQIGANLAALDPADPVAQPFYLQGRIDRIVALRNRVFMPQAVAQYEQLKADEVVIPAYALKAAGDAYLYLQQPERARELYLQALQDMPGDFETRLALFYAHVEAEDFPAAYALVDELRAEQPLWQHPGGVRQPAPNRERLDAETAAALARVFGAEYAEAQARFEKMVAHAPRNPDLIRELANVYSVRGWPRRAQATYAKGLSMAPDHLGLQAGHAGTRLDLSEFAEAEREIADLYALYPENRQVQHLQQFWRIHQMRELQVSAAYADSSGAEPDGRELRLGSTLYSSPFLTHYRAFVSGFWSRADFPEGQGIYQRYGGGAQYRGRALESRVEVSANHSDGGDLGLAWRGTWYRDDHWSFPFALEWFSSETPLRALRNGVDADALRLGADYRVSELRRLGIGGHYLDFSDGNRRLRAQAYLRQRLVTRPHYKLDAILDLGTSVNSRSDVAYFSPEQDASLEATLDNDWLLYRRYSRAFSHRLALSAGLYQQKSFGVDPIGGLAYEHNWQADYRFNLIYGAALRYRVWDGQGETGTEYYLRLGWRL